MIQTQYLLSGDFARNVLLTAHCSFKSLRGIFTACFVQILCVVRIGLPLSAAYRVDRGSELAAYGVVDEEVAGGVDVAEELRDTGHEGEGV